MRKQRTERYDPRRHKDRTDWARVDALTDEDIDAAIASDPDAAPAMTAEDLARARIVYPEPKRPISIRLDGEVIDWFKREGPGY